MEDTSAIYQYCPIAADQEIRVIKLEPAATFDDPLVASLVVLSLHATLNLTTPASDFHCVSYCWGVKGNTHHVRCDDQRLPITENVHQMLRHLRKVLTSRYLWIDAICINQSNDSEKAAQVTAMGLIYQLAAKVHVWLGSASGDDRIPSVFAALRNWALNNQDVPEIDLEGEHASLVVPLKAFMNRPWFTRRWILQEVRVARSVTIHCGAHRSSWEWVRDGMRVLLLMSRQGNSSRFIKDLITAEISYVLESIHSLKRHGTGETTTVLQLLWNHHSNACSDERDRIFALYGLLPAPGRYVHNSEGQRSPNHQANVPVDYTLNFTDIYLQTAASAVMQGNGMTVVTHALVFGSLAQQDPYSPSWVPSWHMTRRMSESPSLSPMKLTIDTEKQNNSSVLEIREPLTLIFGGLLRPILTIQENGGNESIMDFFKCARWPLHREGYGLTRLLLRAILNAGNLYDRAPFDLLAVFSQPELPYPNTEGYEERLHPLSSYLEKELGVTPTKPQEYLEYSASVLRQEVARLLYDHTPFTYLSGRAEVPGIALGKVEVGDYVYRPDEKNNLPEYALILRPFCPPDQNDIEPDTFRLVGCCLDSESWWYRWEKRLPGYALHEQHHDTILLR